MELEELKNAWGDYDQKLIENLKLNEEILRRLNLEKSKKEISTPLNYEIFTVLLGMLFLLMFIISTVRYHADVKFLVSGFTASLTTLIFLIFSIHRLKIMSNIDYYSSAIIDLQKSINRFKQTYFRYKKIELLLSPVFLIAAAPILLKGLNGEDLFLNLPKLTFTVTFAGIIGYSISLWIYKNWYEKKMKNVNDFLEDLKRFEKEHV